MRTVPVDSLLSNAFMQFFILFFEDYIAFSQTVFYNSLIVFMKGIIKMEVKDILKARRQELNMTMKEVAGAVGVNEGTISRWESGDIANMRRDKIMALAKALQLSPAVIMEWDDSYTPLPPYPNIHPITKQSLPVLGEVTCGEPRFMAEQIEFYTDQLEGIHADFILIAHDDSMIGARIHDGDLVFIRKQEEVENGEIAVVAIRDEAMLKRVFYYANKSLLVLRAENPAYKDMEYSGSELNDVHVLGKAVAFQSAVR